MHDSLIESRVSRAESVARRLEAEIMDEVVSPGALLGTKEELRLRFGVAAATVNEAVRLLEMRGLIAARPGRGGGIFVASNSPGLALSHSTLRFKGGSSRFPDYLAVRDALDPLICREAARNHAADDIHALEEDSRADGEDARRSALERADLEDFDGAAHLVEHRDLVVAIDRGESPELEAAVARQSPSYTGND